MEPRYNKKMAEQMCNFFHHHKSFFYWGRVYGLRKNHPGKVSHFMEEYLPLVKERGGIWQEVLGNNAGPTYSERCNG